MVDNVDSEFLDWDESVASSTGNRPLKTLTNSDRGSCQRVLQDFETSDHSRQYGKPIAVDPKVLRFLNLASR